MTAIRPLILSGRLVPATLAPLRNDRDATVNAARATGMVSRVERHGPHAADVELSSDDVAAFRAALGPGYRVSWLNGMWCVRRRLSVGG